MTTNSPDNKPKPSRAIVIICLTIVFAIFLRVLVYFESDGAALVYVAMPVFVTAILLYFSKRNPQVSGSGRYRTVILDSVIVFITSSLVLLEGFLCIIFFVPIYIIVVLVVILIERLWLRSRESRAGRPMVSILPLLLLLSSFEGVNEDVSFNVHNEITVSRIINQDLNTIKKNLVAPSSLRAPSKGFMQIFPAAQKFEASSLEAGQVHKLHYTYKRWFVTNTHEGYQATKIIRATDELVETEIIEDTSYIANYMRLNGTRMEFDEISPKETKVTLTISFKRLLHPGWYFGPMQRYGVKAMGESILDQMVENKE